MAWRASDFEKGVGKAAQDVEMKPRDEWGPSEEESAEFGWGYGAIVNVHNLAFKAGKESGQEAMREKFVKSIKSLLFMYGRSKDSSSQRESNSENSPLPQFDEEELGRPTNVYRRGDQ